jgi:shikimate dehydrogenase
MSEAGEGFLRLGLIGYPLGHSFSPRLHAAALAAAGLRGEYRLYPISPDEAGMREMAALAAELRGGEIRGLNVTIPHKRAVMAYVDRLSDTARQAGAVNTLVLRDGVLWGENTDVGGFLADLHAELALSPGHALVLGAGGSARAVACALVSAGWQVQVAARRMDQAALLAAELADLLGLEPVRARSMHAGDLRAAAPAGTLIVNATPLGMHPNIDGCPWPEDLPLPEGGAVYDLVYNPQETVLVRRARSEGLAAFGGAGMLAAQAALAFSIWTGCPPPFEVMRSAAKAAARS